jgi:hypothetical protein
MKLQTAKCTTCGASLKLEVDKTISECSYCKSQIIVSNALDFNKVEVDKSKDIVKYRDNIKKYIRNNSIEEILRVSNQILDILPKDFLATYFAAYAHQVKGEPKFIYEFLDTKLEFTDEEIKEVIDHLVKRCDLRDTSRISKWLQSRLPEQVRNFLEAVEKRAAEEDNFADVPRDIFICYSSKNESIAKKIVQKLEKDGNTCWVAYRNLRPDDTENYWNNIKKAIDKTSIFLVISDVEAMRSKDVQAEISYAQDRVNRKVEFKIDKIPHTNLFNHVFDGVKWVDAYTNLEKGINTLTKRIFEEKELIKDLINKRQWKGYVRPSTQVLTQKDKKKTLLISGAVFAATLIGVLAFNLFGFADRTPPVITLNGNQTTFVDVNSTYNEPGALVADNRDNNISVVTSGLVNTGTLGNYTITYTAQDRAGNRAVEVKRTVSVVDRTPPVVSLIGSSTVRIKAGELFVDPGANALDNYDPPTKVNQRVVGTVNINLVGTYNIVYTATDSSGNVSAPVTRQVIVEKEVFNINSFSGVTTLVTLDINPSIGLTLNSADQIIDTIAINADASKVLAGLNLAGVSFSNALTSIIKSANTSGFISDKDAILIGIETNNTNKQGSIETLARNAITQESRTLNKTLTPQVEKMSLDFTKAVDTLNGLVSTSAKT